MDSRHDPATSAMSIIHEHLAAVLSVLHIESPIWESLECVADCLLETLRNDRAIFVCGNGGSAADSQHFSTELIASMTWRTLDRPALNVIPLTTNTSVITALANDFGFDVVFSRQLEAHASPGDALIVISTSGNSRNVVHAAATAQRLGLKVVALSGCTPNELEEHADFLMAVPSTDTQVIQTGHLIIEHLLAAIVEKNLWSEM